VPNQGRYALGGDLGVRAVPVDERLGENVALARFELRQTIYPEVDHNFFDWVTFRHGQLRLFVDAGRVEDRRTALYRPSDFAVGVGVGVAGMYDFMGFYPSVAYLAVAQRVDDVDASGVQFLFGTRQAF
jgi:hemolysin activation/secretion protein